MTTSRLVQFLHPGGERGLDRRITASKGQKEWNYGKHKRKFLLAEGSWTWGPRKPPAKGSLTFWGEWESQSEVRHLAQNPQAGYPRWIHTPHLSLEQIEVLQKQGCAPCAPGGPQNTDPLVFGDRFRYVLCQQFRQYKGKPRPTRLAQLGRGDIILFGSCVGGHFALDTVFVVGIYAPIQRNGPLPKWESDLHRKITVDLIDIPSCGLRLYEGATWSLDKPFSFVPCMPVDVVARGFPRPVIEPSGILSKMLSPEQKQGCNIAPLGGPENAAAIWDAVVEQVLFQGCALGIAIGEPDDARLLFTVAAFHSREMAIDLQIQIRGHLFFDALTCRRAPIARAFQLRGDVRR